MNSLRIIFMGTPDFAVPALNALISGPDQVVAVVSQPDRPRGRGKKLLPTPVKQAALAAGLPVLQPVKIKTGEFRDELAAFRPDVMVVAAYGRILPPPLLELPPYGCINIHGSILPKYRGAAPIQWAVMNGDKQSGISIMQMDEGMDTGDILHLKTIKLAADETAGSLFNKLAELGGTAILEALQMLKEGRLQPISQDHQLAVLAPMLKKEDGHIDWRQDAQIIHNKIRGLDPWPSAFCFLEQNRLRLFRPEVVYMDSGHPPGTIISTDKDGLLIAAGKNCLKIAEVQPEGKKRMKASDFVNGHTISKHTLLN